MMSIVESNSPGEGTRAGSDADQLDRIEPGGDTGSPDVPVPRPGASAIPIDPDAGSRGLDSPVDSSGGGSSPGTRRVLTLLGAGGLVAAAAVGFIAVSGDEGQTADGSAAQPIRAVTAETRDLVDFTDLDGTLGYSRTRTVVAALPDDGVARADLSSTGTGTITAVAADGARLQRGDTVYEINTVPVLLLHGETPLYRPLERGDEGDDVALLEANLASLGYHIEPVDSDEDDALEIDTGFTVDGNFDAATADAVRRWQADHGRPETGRIEVGDFVVTPGPVVATNPRVDTGSVVPAGAPVIDLNEVGTVTAFHSPTTGEIELLVGSGPIATGQVLYTVDDLPVTALVTDEIFERDLFDGVSDGEDIRVLEQMLVDLGYDARGDLDPDDEFDDITAEAVEDWESDLEDQWPDVDVDGRVDLGQVVVVEPGTEVGAITPRSSDVVATGSELFWWSSGEAERVVRTTIAVDQQDSLSLGQTVEVEFPGGATVAGTVVELATSSTIDPTDPGAEPELAVEIALDSVPDDAARFAELDVTVKLVDRLASGATVVPASALLATANGDYAVEVVDPGTGAVDVVVVEPGMFADGFVEVVGIDPGTAVVVPS